MGNRITRIIPNTLTCCNLISGCIATVTALYSDAIMALTWIIIGATFDFFDGMSARLLNVTSPIGKELDSLADDITFGIAPSSIVFMELVSTDYPSFLEHAREYLPYTAYIMAAFSALRLAKFNIDKRQTSSFVGMPTPANALFWGSLIAVHSSWLETSPNTIWILLSLIAFSSWLLISEIPMFALKFKHWGFRGNEIKYIFIMFSIAAIFVFGFLGSFTIIIPCYLFISISIELKKKCNKGCR